MIEIETSSGFEAHYYVFEKTKNYLEPYKSWDGRGYYSMKDAEKYMKELQESFPELEFEVFRVSVEKEDCV